MIENGKIWYVDVLKGMRGRGLWGDKRLFFELDFMEGFYKKIKISDVIKFKISIDTQIQETLSENLKN